MDSHVFRRVCAELVPILVGSRIEKVHQCGKALMFTVYAQGSKRFLYLLPERNNPFLFLSVHRSSAQSAPPAPVMRLRKHLSHRRITEARIHWTDRRLYLRAGGDPETWLELDLREGARLRLGSENAPAAAPPPFEEPRRPDPSRWEDLCVGEGLCERPVLTPALRRTLPLLPKDEQATLLRYLESGEGKLFVYPSDDPRQTLLSAWPLPESLRRGRHNEVVESPLSAVTKLGEALLLREAADAAQQRAARPHSAAAARLRRLLNKLEGEKQRLTALAALQEQALALQAELYLFGPEEKRDRVELRQGELIISLNPALTVRENMAALFRKAAKGRRGLAIIKERSASAAVELARAEHACRAADSEAPGPETGFPAPPLKPGTAQLPKGVQKFRSSDGFTLLRGRDAEGNRLLLKSAAPHDLWLHAAGVAGAHVLIRRSHAAQTVPMTTLEEAGVLAALKSERRGEARVSIMVAQARHVHSFKGGKIGQVRVDRVEPSCEVRPDPGLEARLRV